MLWILIAALLSFSVFQPEQDTTPIEFDGVHFKHPSDFRVTVSHAFDDPAVVAQIPGPEHISVYVTQGIWYGTILILDAERDEEMREANALTGVTKIPSEDEGFALQEIEGEGLVGTRGLLFAQRDENAECYPNYATSYLIYHYAGKSTDERFTVYAFFTMNSDSIEEVEFPEDPTREECDEYYAAYEAQWKAADDLNPDPADLDILFSTMTFDDDALSELVVGQEKTESDYLEFGVKTHDIFAPHIMTITIPIFVTDSIEMISNEDGGAGARWENEERYGEIIGYTADDYRLIEGECGDYGEQLDLLEEILNSQPEEPEIPCLSTPVDGEYSDFHYVSFPDGQGIAYLVDNEGQITYHFSGIANTLGLTFYLEATIPVTTLEETTLERLDGIMKSIVWPCC